jgi:hypothetical protein
MSNLAIDPFLKTIALFISLGVIFANLAQSRSDKTVLLDGLKIFFSLGVFTDAIEN